MKTEHSIVKLLDQWIYIMSRLSACMTTQKAHTGIEEAKSGRCYHSNHIPSSRITDTEREIYTPEKPFHITKQPRRNK